MGNGKYFLIQDGNCAAEMGISKLVFWECRKECTRGLASVAIKKRKEPRWSTSYKLLLVKPGLTLVKTLKLRWTFRPTVTGRSLGSFLQLHPLKEDFLWEAKAIFLDLASDWLLEDWLVRYWKYTSYRTLFISRNPVFWFGWFSLGFLFVCLITF